MQVFLRPFIKHVVCLIMFETSHVLDVARLGEIFRRCCFAVLLIDSVYEISSRYCMLASHIHWV